MLNSAKLRVSTGFTPAIPLWFWDLGSQKASRVLGGVRLHFDPLHTSAAESEAPSQGHLLREQDRCSHSPSSAERKLWLLLSFFKDTLSSHVFPTSGSTWLTGQLPWEQSDERVTPLSLKVSGRSLCYSLDPLSACIKHFYCARPSQHSKRAQKSKSKINQP